jgi:hypothetical protein
MQELKKIHLQNCKILPTRVDLIKQMPQNSIGAELGIWGAEFSRPISKIIKPQLFYLVDTWDNMDLEERFTDNFIKRSKNSNYIKRKETSESFLNSLDDKSLDWVYIDAAHDYDSVVTDLKLSKDKVKDDGYIMGHDFINYDYINHFDYGVKKAVHNFLHSYDYEMVYFTLDWDGYSSYCLKKKKKDKGLDQFYTNSDVAKKCVDTIDFSKYDIVVEPSAGTGAFYNIITHSDKIGMDLEPKCDGVKKQDFLKWELDAFFPKPKVLTIGNPPFGRQSSDALKFIKHAAEFSDTIAFILPRGFKKRSVYDRVPLNFWKVNEFDIPKNSFIFNDKPHDVPCVWIEYKIKNELRVKEEILKPTTFEFITVTEFDEFGKGKPPTDANVSIRRVGVNAGFASADTNVSTPPTYFVKVDSDKVNEFVEKVNKIKFSNGDTTGPRSISKHELISKIETYNVIT